MTTTQQTVSYGRDTIVTRLVRHGYPAELVNQWCDIYDDFATVDNSGFIRTGVINHPYRTWAALIQSVWLFNNAFNIA